MKRDIETVLREFLDDVELAYGGTGSIGQTAANLAADWPDLAVTYLHAVRAIRQVDNQAQTAGHAGKQGATS